MTPDDALRLILEKTDDPSDDSIEEIGFIARTSLAGDYGDIPAERSRYVTIESVTNEPGHRGTLLDMLQRIANAGAGARIRPEAVVCLCNGPPTRT